ncbi:MAG TPA: hypothetical protein PK951_06905, partial [Chitinophagaceae bacterium]|nr:hypothetical protein [Chitinophagaceae bacterium]
MKKRLLLVAGIILSLQFNLFSADGDYSVARIPKALLKNANAVLRLEEQRFEIRGTKEARFTNHYVITILNEKGDRWAGFVDYYDKHRSI